MTLFCWWGSTSTMRPVQCAVSSLWFVTRLGLNLDLVTQLAVLGAPRCALTIPPLAWRTRAISLCSMVRSEEPLLARPEKTWGWQESLL